MSGLEKKHFDAAGSMMEVFATRLGKDRGVHAETVIAAAARMAGTMLFRSFGFDTSKMHPGDAILSEEANEKGPELIGIVVAMMQEYGLQPDMDRMAQVNQRGEPPKLTVLEMQELLENDLTVVREEYKLSLEEGARSCALVTAWLIRECAPQIGLEVGFNIAALGFIEGSKTVPRNAERLPGSVCERQCEKSVRLSGKRWIGICVAVVVFLIFIALCSGIFHTVHVGYTPITVAQYTDGYFSEKPTFTEFTTSDKKIAEVYVEFPEGRRFFLPDFTEKDASEVLKNFREMEMGSSVKGYYDGGSHFMFFDGKLRFATIHGGLFKISPSKDGPYLAFPIQEKDLIETFGKPEWRLTEKLNGIP